MNGRVYDPTVGRFLSADPTTQFPKSLQGLNRYSYVLNNPLTYTDPSGYFLGGLFKGIGKALGSVFKDYGIQIAAIAITIYAPYAAGATLGPGGAGVFATTAGGELAGAFVGGFAGGLLASRGDLKTGIIGAVSAGTLQGIGGSSLSPFEKVGAHGLVGGAASEAQGGEFGTGFLSSAIAASAGNGAAKYFPGNNGAGTVVAAIAGGTTSELSGGKFANGAITASFAYAFNQASQGQPQPTNPPHVDAFFENLYPELSSLALDLGVYENNILGLAAYESGWYNAHNQGLNNPFGLTRAGGNNLKFDSVSDAVNYWKQTFGPQVQGIQSPTTFVDRLLSPPRVYNSVNPDWRKNILSTIRTVERRKPIWEEKRDQR